MRILKGLRNYIKNTVKPKLQKFIRTHIIDKCPPELDDIF